MNVRSCLLHVLRGWLVAALALFSLSAQAVVWDQYTDIFWDAGTGKATMFPGKGSGQTWTNTSPSRMGASATGPTYTTPPKGLPFNPSPTASFKQTFKPSKMAKAFMSPSIILPLAAGSMLAAALDQACVRIFGGSMELAPGGQWEQCNMTSGTQKQWSWQAGTPTNWFNSTSGAWTHYVANNPPCCGYSYQNARHFDAQNKTVFDVHNQFGQRIQQDAEQLYQTRTINTSTQNGWKTATNSEAETLLASKLEQWSQADFLYGRQSGTGDAQKWIDEWFKKGQSVDVTGDGMTVTGEQTTITSPPKVETTTNSDGSSKTTTSTTTNNYTYNTNITNNTVTVTHTQTTSVVTSSRDANNAPIGTTTTTITDPTTKDPEKVDECEGSAPDRLDCMKVGTPETKDPLSKETLAFTIGTESFTGGACPAPVAFTAMGRPYSFSYQPLCDQLAYVKALLLALAALAAAWIVADGFRVN